MKEKQKKDTLWLELKKIGLTEKQSRVYLSALELGYTSVKNIAQKAKISRPTTYKIIKELAEKKLIRVSDEKERKYFTAQSPDYLLGILKRQKKELEEKEREFIRIISILRSKYYLKDEREIKHYQGKAGLSSIVDDFLTSQATEIYVFVANEKIINKKQRENIYKNLRKRLGKIKIKEFSKTKKKPSLPFLKTKIPKNDGPDFNGVIIVYDKLAILNLSKNNLLINNKEIVILAKSFFDFIWKIS